MSFQLPAALQKKLGAKQPEDLKPLQFQRTGIAPLDAALQGGLLVGRVAMIWGPPSVGKSSLSLNIMQQVLHDFPDKWGLYIDLEGTVTESDVTRHNIERILFKDDAYGGEEAIEAILAAFNDDTNPAKIVVVDSIPFMRSKAVLEEMAKDAEYRDVSGIANLIERSQANLRRAVSAGGILIFINQERPAQSKYTGPTCPGGSALKFLLSTSIHLSSSKVDKERLGHTTVKATVRKNKGGPSGLSMHIEMLDRVVEKELSLIEAAKEFGAVTMKGGGHYSLTEEFAAKIGRTEIKLAQSAEKVAKVLREDPELYQALYDYTIEKSREMLKPEDLPGFEGI